MSSPSLNTLQADLYVQINTIITVDESPLKFCSLILSRKFCNHCYVKSHLKNKQNVRFCICMEYNVSNKAGVAVHAKL